MRIATLTALISVTFASTFFAACSSDDSGGGNTGGKTTVGGSGGVPVGGAGGSTSGGAGGTTSGGAGGSTSGGSGGGTGAVTMPASCVKPGTLVTNCNPVTNEGCTGTGEACDLSDKQSFECFDPPNDVPVGGACDLSKGPYCLPKHKCQDKICRQYCCTNADCTGGGTCKAMSSQVGTLGYCDVGGSDGGTDAGGDASADAAGDATSDATPSDASGDATGD
ncbi:MAG: hypothetical protein HYZ29_03720 [Myxococcales bacterium]|nr:hypothetical protein [Myxococcales bacterium]